MASGILDRRYRDGDVEFPPVFGQANSFEMIEAFSAPDPGEDLLFLRLAIRGINRMIEVPIISSAVYPKMRSAPEFQLVMILFKSLPMIASSDEATMAASRREVISDRWRCVTSRRLHTRPWLRPSTNRTFE